MRPYQINLYSLPHLRLYNNNKRHLQPKHPILNGLTYTIQNSQALHPHLRILRSMMQTNSFWKLWLCKGYQKSHRKYLTSFDALIASSTQDSKTTLHYLCKFLKGESLKMVEHYQDLHHDADTAYCRAREELKYRYGNVSVLTVSMDKKLTEWPKIGRDSSRELLHFSDFLN